MSDHHFSTIRKIRFQDCDSAGIVFYPRYYEMLNAVVEDWFDGPLDYPWNQLHLDFHSGVPTAEIHTKFLAPSRLGDMVDFRLTVTRLGNSSVGFTIDAWCGDEQRLQHAATIVHIDKNTGKALPWPDILKQRIENQQNNPA